jgi:hypothetical protein
MKKFFAMVAFVLPLTAMMGCEPFPTTNEDEGKAEFVNKSSYLVLVKPEANSGWSSFALEPGERKKFSDIYDLFFSYQPQSRVTVGKNSDGKVVFVNDNADLIEVETVD